MEEQLSENNYKSCLKENLSLKSLLESIWFDWKVKLKDLKLLNLEKKMIMGAIIKNKFDYDIDLNENKLLKKQLNSVNK